MRGEFPIASPRTRRPTFHPPPRDERLDPVGCDRPGPGILRGSGQIRPGQVSQSRGGDQKFRGALPVRPRPEEVHWRTVRHDGDEGVAVLRPRRV